MASTFPPGSSPVARHLPLILLLFFITPALTLHFSLIPHLLWQPAPVELVLPPPVEPKPDFAGIESVPERKSVFFDYIQSHVTQQNHELLALRERLETNQLTPEELLALAELYRVKEGDPAHMRERLLLKVDALPVSLVLAQAALESAWGTSRFAALGNNFFGQWCFVPGCGLVPGRRNKGLSHEVTVFETPEESVASYMRNLNSHPAYRFLRERRAELRQRGEPLNGCFLAQGLTQYSAKGGVYVEDLKNLIRNNRLERDSRGYCAPAVAQQEPKPAVPAANPAPAASPTPAPGNEPAAPSAEPLAVDETPREAVPVQATPAQTSPLPAAAPVPAG